EHGAEAPVGGGHGAGRREPHVAGEERGQRELLHAPHQHGVEERAAEQQADDHQAGAELGRDDDPVGHGIGEEELERPEPPLLREETHGEQRNRQHQDQADVDEDELPEVLHDAEAEPELDEVDQVGVEVVAGVGEEGGGDEVDEGRPEVRPQLLAQQCREGAHHWTARTNRSSSVGVTVRTSSSVQPRPTTRPATARCTGSARSARTTNRGPASPGAVSVSTPSTPGSDASAAATSAGGPSTRTTTRSAPSRRAARPAGVSSATIWPPDMMTIREHSAPASASTWVDSSTVQPSSPRSSSRISTVWTGSSPTVGSSRTSTGGSPSSACARPTRW